MRQHVKSEGLVIKKTKLRGENILITIFTKEHGKITVAGFGVKKITSRRLSHLETGNYIRFAYSKVSNGNSLGETDLLYGYSKIRKSEQKLHELFLTLVVLNRILPEDVPEPLLFELTKAFLKNLNNVQDIDPNAFNQFLISVLLAGGFIDDDTAQKDYFDAIDFTEELIGQKIRS